MNEIFKERKDWKRHKLKENSKKERKKNTKTNEWINELKKKKPLLRIKSLLNKQRWQERIKHTMKERKKKRKKKKKEKRNLQT